MVEVELLKVALAEAGGNKLNAAALRGIQRRLLYEKMNECAFALIPQR
jgi:DNA-binding NtrC family response regulator